jgi:hypothetical protein
LVALIRKIPAAQNDCFLEEISYKKSFCTTGFQQFSFKFEVVLQGVSVTSKKEKFLDVDFNSKWIRANPPIRVSVRIWFVGLEGVDWLPSPCVSLHLMHDEIALITQVFNSGGEDRFRGDKEYLAEVAIPTGSAYKIDRSTLTSFNLYFAGSHSVAATCIAIWNR